MIWEFREGKSEGGFSRRQRGWGGERAFIQGVLVRLVQEQRVQGERLRVWKKKKEEKVLRGGVSTEAAALLTGEVEERKQKILF